jgi:hypothetical protein
VIAHCRHRADVSLDDAGRFSALLSALKAASFTDALRSRVLANHVVRGVVTA